MAQKSKPRTPRKSSYRGFEGVDLKKTHSGDESIAFIDNFRITSDGSLEKRYGFNEVYRDTGKTSAVKASYSTIEDDKEVCYFTHGKYVKKYDSSTAEVYTIGTLSADDMNMFFFEYLNTLYICDGYKIFTVLPDSLSDAHFYIPLYGKDWNAFEGDLNELPNLLWPKIAISYKLTPPAKSYLSLGHLNISSIDAVYRNGQLLNPDQYYMHEEYNSITVPQFADNDEFLAIVTFVPNADYERERKELLSSNHTSFFYELNKNNMFFWGSKNNNKIFYSTGINEESSKITFLHPQNNAFYIPIGSFFSVASKKDRVNALIRHYDRVLIMTDSSTWITNLEDLESNSLKLDNINSSIGCNIPNGCVRIENSLFSVGKDAIYEWTSDTDKLNECNAYSISSPIQSLLGSMFFKQCLLHLNYDEREIWFYHSYQKKVWIYNYERKIWYSYSGFSPSAFLDGGMFVRFFEGNSLYAFNSSFDSDIRDSEEHPITAQLISGELEFNSRNKKKLCTTTIRGICSDGSMTLNIKLDGKDSLTYDVTLKDKHSVIPFRTRSGSFNSMTFSLVATGKGKQIIHGIELDAD